ncbi:MAG: zinc-ribbon domain-containing protein, partial [Mangrovicoccus sp.]
MQLFACPDCGNRVYFENHVCASCNAQLVFDPAEGEFAPDRPICANRSKIGCNWAASGESEYCHSCQMTDVTPDLGLAKNVALWAEGEEDKRWVLYGLGHWGWFGPSDPGQLPVFHFKSETTRRGNVP